jgi:hypothetical protein
MNYKTLPNPARCREIPAQFSWVDHRLVRDGYFEKCSCEALALYLFLLTVADEKGVSYYGQTRLMKQLKLDNFRLLSARDELVRNQLISYQKPLYQVLNLLTMPMAMEKENKKTQQQAKSQTVKEWLEQLSLEVRHD